MEKRLDLSSDAISPPFGLALIVFGEPAVARVLRQPKWADRYMSLLSNSGESEADIYATPLPGEVLFEVADMDECLYDFWADADGIRLYAVERDRQWAEPPALEGLGATKIRPREALLEYGAIALFTAVDKGTGLRGER